MINYYGGYADFTTPDKDAAARLMSADNMVGDVYDIVCEMDSGQHVAWLDNRFEQRIGRFDEETSRELALKAAEGLSCKAILSFVAFTERAGVGEYWGCAGIVCFSPAYAEEFDRFIEGVSAKIAEDVRPKLDFGAEGAQKVVDSDGDFIPKQTVSLPDKQPGRAILKRRRSMTDKLVEQGRAGNKGCYFASWVVLLAAVALVLFALYSCTIGGGAA